MSERMRQAVGTILGAGFQVESDAFKTLVEIGGGATLDKLVEEVLKMANAAAPRPMSISRDLVLKAAEQLDLSSKSLFSETGLGGPRRFAQEVSSRLEVVSDPSGKLGTTGAFDDFLHYFRSRFEKMSKMFGQRMDTSRHGTIAEALQGGANGRARFICMVVEKREKTDQDRGRVFLTVDDYEDEATVLVTDQTPELYQTARKIIRDQVVYLETRKSSGELLVAEKIVLPEIPEHRPHLSDEEVYAALISDVHVGSKVFLEDAFRRVLAWLKGDWGVSYEREIADRVKYVIICGNRSLSSPRN